MSTAIADIKQKMVTVCEQPDMVSLTRASLREDAQVHINKFWLHHMEGNKDKRPWEGSIQTAACMRRICRRLYVRTQAGLNATRRNPMWQPQAV